MIMAVSGGWCGVGRALRVGIGLGVIEGVGVAVGVPLGVGVTVGDGVGVGVGPDCAQYLPPVATAVLFTASEIPPQTIISLPVQTAV